jgi:hypothetical protein
MSDAEQNVQEAAAEFMRTVPVQDVIVSMVQTVFDVGYRRTGLVGGGGARDLAQTALAIETVRALLPVLERVLEPASMTTLRSALSELQLAYAESTKEAAKQEAGGPQAAKAAEGDAPPQASEQAAPGESPIAAERPKIWTPGGDV